MHVSAYNTGKSFFDTYCKDLTDIKVVDIGSQDVNGSLRDHAGPNVKEYVGVDFAEGKGVDVVLTDPYKFPFEDNTFDVCVTSSCFEHSEMFWLTFLESIRILKDDGIMYCNVPSAWMSYHRYPVDCWRFYPDAGKGLETWAKYNNYNTKVLETYVCPFGPGETVLDWACVFIKNADHMDKYPNRMIDKLEPYKQFVNAYRFPKDERFTGTWDQPAAEYPQSVLVLQTKGEEPTEKSAA